MRATTAPAADVLSCCCFPVSATPARPKPRRAPCTPLRPAPQKRLYNWFAQSQRLLTAPRVALGTLTAVLLPLALVGVQRTLAVWAALLVVTVAAGYYGEAGP